MVKELHFSNNPPKNLYMILEMNGAREGGRYKDIRFMIPVLSFCQPQLNSTNWYVVTFRQCLIKDEFNNYYYDEFGVEYELIMLPTVNGDVYSFGENHCSLAFCDGSFECFRETVKFYYERELTRINERVRMDEEKVNCVGLLEFLREYRPFVEDNFPHILL